MTLFVSFMRLLTELLGLMLLAALFSFLIIVVFMFTGSPLVLMVAIVIPPLATWAVSRPLGLWSRNWIAKVAVISIAVLIPGLAAYHVNNGIWL